ncbi:MAG: outer-membrane lipoprotein carrier protein LolA [Ignavibacteria bacterium]|nr:outer-membrane lipoprotein carrier protein LolA [Ignavibacteria bacterium]
MKNIIGNSIIIVVLFVSIAHTQTDGSELLDDLQTRFNAIDDLTAEFTQSTNGKTFLSGVFLFKKENMVKIIAKQLIIVSDGTTSWSYNKKENKVIISNFDENDPGVFSINELVYNFPKECDLSSTIENGERVLTLVSNGYKYNFNKVQIWLSTDDLISKVIFSDPAFGETEVTFFNYKLNQNFSDSEFSFIPPAGSKIIDLR